MFPWTTGLSLGERDIRLRVFIHCPFPFWDLTTPVQALVLRTVLWVTGRHRHPVHFLPLVPCTARMSNVKSRSNFAAVLLLFGDFCLSSLALWVACMLGTGGRAVVVSCCVSRGINSRPAPGLCQKPLSVNLAVIGYLDICPGESKVANWDASFITVLCALG